MKQIGYFLGWIFGIVAGIVALIVFFSNFRTPTGIIGGGILFLVAICLIGIALDTKKKARCPECKKGVDAERYRSQTDFCDTCLGNPKW